MKYFILIPLLISCTLWNNKNSPDYKPDLVMNHRGELFPKFIYDYFPSSHSYLGSNDEEGVKLLEVKRFNPISQESNEANLSWSPNGYFMGFEELVEDRREIYLKNLSNAFSKHLAVLNSPSISPSDPFLFSIKPYNTMLRWSYNGTYFSFMSNGSRGEYNIYVGSMDLEAKPIFRKNARNGYANWSPKTDELAFVSSTDGSVDVFVLDMNNEAFTKLSNESTMCFYPEWLEDGNKIFYSSGEASNHQLKVVERDKSNWSPPRRLTYGNQDEMRPKPSPDGTFLAFYSAPERQPYGEKTWNLHLIRILPNKTYTQEELEQSVIATNVYLDLGTGPAWSPDGKKIFYILQNSELYNPIFAYDLNTRKHSLIPTNTKMNRDMTLSSYGVLSFSAQVGAWDKVFVALTNQGLKLNKGL